MNREQEFWDKFTKPGWQKAFLHFKNYFMMGGLGLESEKQWSNFYNEAMDRLLKYEEMIYTLYNALERLSIWPAIMTDAGPDYTLDKVHDIAQTAIKQAQDKLLGGDK